MNLHLAVWCFAFVGLAVATFVKPRWGIALYFLTLFASPPLWWWGRGFTDIRPNLIASFIIIVALVVHGRVPVSDAVDKWYRLMRYLVIMIVANATFVHCFLAADTSISYDALLNIWKYAIGLYFVLALIRSDTDFRFLCIVLTCGLAYIGYEVVLQGWQPGGARLERVGTPGAYGSNAFGQLIIMLLPLVGSLIFWGSVKEKMLGVFASITSLELLNLCNSRGAFLGLLAGACVFPLVARGKTRRRAFLALALAGIGAFAFLLRDPRVVGRFESIFAEKEERDISAEIRLTVWPIGLQMIGDYPLGSGGWSFKKTQRGIQYKRQHRDWFIENIGGEDTETRALHNGFLTEAVDWGVQGLALKLWLVAVMIVSNYKTSGAFNETGSHRLAIVGPCLIAGAIAFLVRNITNDGLDNEPFYWLVGLSMTYRTALVAVAARTSCDVGTLPSSLERNSSYFMGRADGAPTSAPTR